jgi:hypothetical protein
MAATGLGHALAHRWRELGMRRSWLERSWVLLGVAVMIVTFTALKLLRDDGPADRGFLAFASVLLALVVAGLLLTRRVGRRR